MDRSLHVTGILIYRYQRNNTEILLVNDNFNHKRHWTGPKGRVIGDEDELKCALRETLEITGLTAKDIKVDTNFRTELKYLAGTSPKRVIYYLAELTDNARVLPNTEGLQYSWCNLQNATDKALYRNMQEALKLAFAAADEKKVVVKYQAAAPRNLSTNSSDSIESNMKNLNIALPLDSQRQALTRGYSNREGNNDRRERSGEQREYNNSGRYNSRGGDDGSRGEGHQQTRSQADNPNYKTRLCERFETEQFCPYYAKCTYAHGAAELRQRPVQENTERISAVQASYQARRQENSENEFLKTRLCERFMADGNCPFGAKCTYAHGREELRQRAGGNSDQSGGYNNRYQNNRGGDNGNNGEDRPSYRSYRSNNGRDNTFDENNGNGGYRSQPYQQNGEQRSNRSVREPLRSLGGEPREGPYRPPQLDTADKPYRPIPDTNNTTGIYRPPAHRASPALGVTPVLAPATSVVATAAAVAAQSDKAPVVAAPVATAPVASLGTTNGGRRRPQETVTEKPRAKVVEMSSEDMEKFQLRRPETPVAAAKVDTKQALHEQLIQDLIKYFQTSSAASATTSGLAATAADKKKAAQQIQEEIKEVTRVEMRNGLTKAQLYQILLPSLFTESSVETWKKVLADKEKLLANFVRSTDDQVLFMRAWEQLFIKSRGMMGRAPIVFKALYDVELVEEDVMLKWYDLAKTDAELKKKCQVFIDWLREAEEE